MARDYGPIYGWHRGDTIPTEAEGGYAGAASTAAAVRMAQGQATQAVQTVDNLSATATTLPPGSPATATVSGPMGAKVVNFSIPRGADGAPGMGHEEGQQLLAQNQTTLTAAQAAQAAAEGSAWGAREAVTLAQQAQAAALEVPDDNVSALVGNPTTDTRAVLDSTYATRRLGLAPSSTPLRALPYNSSNPSVIDVFDGTLWGYQGNTIHKSTDNGETWAAHCPSPVGDVVLRLMPCDDGEVLSVRVGGVYKSTGWAGGSPSWELKVARTGAAAFQQFQVDGDGAKFIVAQYGPGGAGSQARKDSRYGHISLDGGDTWTQVWDSVAMHGATESNLSHIHGVCYDSWSDRFYLSEGHAAGAGLWVSEDDGATWTLPVGLIASPSPTTITATDDGLVCGSDHSEPGVWGVVRQANPADEKFAHTWVWRDGRPGLIGFGMRSHRDPATGVVYIGYRTDGSVQGAPIIAGGTAAAGGHVFTLPGEGWVTLDSFTQVVVNDGVIHATSLKNGSTDATWRARLPAPTGGEVVDEGGVLGGTSDGTSVAVGTGSLAETTDSVAVGSYARITATSGGSMIAVGSNAQVSGAGGVALGADASAAASAFAMGFKAVAGNESVVIGPDASTVTGQTRAVAIGRNVVARGQSVAIGWGSAASVGGGTSQSVAVGDSATAAGNSVAVGRSSNAGGNQSTAIGHGAVATYGGSVAIGQGSTTTSYSQVAVGSRHIHMTPVSGHPPIPTSGAIFYTLLDDTTGKTTLYARLPSGMPIVIAAEA